MTRVANEAIACPQCTAPMEALALEGHYGQPVQTDLCGHCNLIWLDAFESINLSGLGWVQLLRRMQLATATPTAPMRDTLDCPRCRSRLSLVHNQSRAGHFGELECPRCRGNLASFALLLARCGFVRPFSRRDLDTLAKEGREASCLNCGAGIAREHAARPDAREAHCTYCRSPLLAIDMPRFLDVLLRRHAENLPREGQRLAWACRGCGAPLEPTHGAACEHCGHWVVVPSLVDLRPLLDAVEPALRAMRPRGGLPHMRSRAGDASETALARYVLRLRAWITGR
ncbi:MAG: hypothetical protein JO369_02800 [Paucibacter sp.]|nr:hypothetical protein [Roseateles sp.]